MLSVAEAAKMAYEAVEARVGGDLEKSSALMAMLHADSDLPRMYAVCCSIAHIGRHALLWLFGERAPDLERGEQWAIEQIEPGVLDADPVQAFAVRFLVAYCNEDQATDEALFMTAVEGGVEHLVACVARLVTDVAALYVAVLRQQVGEGPG
ncbi:hypothetical protein [Streptomyces sp. NPDC059063]|uniref:hypothetical protein n=1 Tax=Streptomyces sp. NPDC059063 TaxID=3346712 RepID=UPI00367D13C1